MSCWLIEIAPHSLLLGRDQAHDILKSTELPVDVDAGLCCDDESTMKRDDYI